jgi:hypothetical protein
VLNKEVESLSNEEESKRNEQLLTLIPEEIVPIVTKYVHREYDQQVMHILAYVLKGLCSDSPVTTFLPWRYHSDMRSALDLYTSNSMDSTQNVFKNVAPEFFKLLELSKTNNMIEDVTRFIYYLLDFSSDVHSDDIDINSEPIEGSYQPAKGIAYYFTEGGNQVRKTPEYSINCATDKSSCSKYYPSPSKSGFSYMFLWFCPVHGHCYGFHLVPSSEGRKDPFYSLYKYLPEPPEEVFYDFACSLSEYSLNRAPKYARNIRFFHDVFHGFNHKCGFGFRSRRIPELQDYNTEVCEQFNSFIQCIKYTASHLSQPHFCLFMQFFIYLYNKDKTAKFEKKACLHCLVYCNILYTKHSKLIIL